MNNFINISDLSKNELRSIIDGAKKRKSERGKKPNSQPDTVQPIKGKTLAWLGDGNNVANSFIEAAVKFEFALNIACPKKYQPDKKIVSMAKKIIANS